VKIYERIVMDWDGNVLEEDSFEYEGPVALAGGGGGKRSKTPEPPPTPPTPPKPATEKGTTAAANEAVEAQDAQRKKYMGQQGTILTSPMGAAPAQQQGKQLLGQ
jgi:hypothetical protein